MLRPAAMAALLGTLAVADPGRADVEAQAVQLLDDGQAAAAIELLKPAIALAPTERRLRWLLARGYLLDGNDFWALRTLGALAALDAGDCEPALWIAWIQLRQGALDQARDGLLDAVCPDGTPAQARRQLLLALVEQHAGRRRLATAHLFAARQVGQLFAEDVPALDQLVATLDPAYVAPLAGKLDLDLGWTTNARAGSPVDLATSDVAAASPAGQINGWLRLIAPAGNWWRPALELEARSLGFGAEAGRDLSYLMLGGRPAVHLGSGAPDNLVGYRFEALLLAGGDRYGPGPLWFYNAHRLELEVAPRPGVTVFGGGGRRLFRELGRSRIEVDTGVGGNLRPLPWLRVLGALTGRGHQADKRSYDLLGATALASAEFRLPADWSLRTGALVAADHFPHSSGVFDPNRPADDRSDLLVRLSASGFSPTWSGLRAGVTYEFADRLSTAARYRYLDHRLLLRLIWNFSFDPWAPAAVAPAGHVRLDHGIAAAGYQERLQDLLRQDEAAQRSSSCVE